jgi:hypothetical protein
MLSETCIADINKEIIEFIEHNKIATVCCTAGTKPSCFNCFYSVLEEEGYLIFKSAENTTHMQVLAENKQVAGTIIASEISMAKIEGIQFEGIIADRDIIGVKATKSYYLRYPFAVTVPGRLWILELNSIKYTNTTKGIKHKSEWDRYRCD